VMKRLISIGGQEVGLFLGHESQPEPSTSSIRMTRVSKVQLPARL
jgi:hypothetical protein